MKQAAFSMMIPNLAIAQLLLPLFGALLIGVSFNQQLAGFSALCISFLSLILSIYVLLKLPLPPYIFGCWQAEVGIEHSFNYLNQPLIIFLNGSLLFIIAFCHQQLDKCLLQYIDHRKRSLFYALLLFAHTGYLGILSTNDLFNLYVFIEIASLSTYVLVALGNKRAALIGGFNYLIIGTVSATFILLGIGFLFAVTGHLNINSVMELISISDNYANLKITGLSFIIAGCLLKIAVFPLCFWLVRIYKDAPAIIIAYISLASSLTSVYLFLRFASVLNYAAIFWQILKIMAVLALIFGALLASLAKNLKTLIGYASISQMGVVLIILSYVGNEDLALKFIYLDNIGKLSWLVLASFYESQNSSLSFQKMQALPKQQFLRCLVVLCLLYNASLPLTAMFMLKLSILNLALTYGAYFVFVALVVNNLLSLQYNYKIFHHLFFGVKNQALKFNCLPLLILVLLQVALLFEYTALWPSSILTNTGLR